MSTQTERIFQALQTLPTLRQMFREEFMNSSGKVSKQDTSPLRNTFFQSVLIIPELKPARNSKELDGFK